MDIKVKEEVLDVHEDYSDVFIDCDIVKEEATIQEVNVSVQSRETATNGELVNFEAIDNESKDETQDGHKCEVCGKIFSKALYLTRHMYSHSEQRHFQCTICLKSFKHNPSLIKHVKTHTEDPIPCDICKTILKNSYGLKVHMKRQHEKFKVQVECEKCGKMFSTKTHLNIHNKRVHENAVKRKALTCPFCDMTFKSSFNHKRHVARHSENLDCKICFQKFRNRYLLKNHMGIHNPPKETFPCQICNKTFRLKGFLQSHQETHLTPGNGSDCIYCSKSFKKRSELQTHMKFHHRGLPKIEGATPSCTICKKDYKNIEDLKKHVEIHRLKNRFECAICGAETKFKYLLEKHIRRMHLRIPDIRDRKDAKCPVCFKNLARRHLKAHMVTHSTERPFACDICGKKYKAKQQLKVHKFSHLAFKTKQGMKCVYCEKKFHLKRALSVHIRDRHRGLPNNAIDPPFKCTICKKSCEILDDLKEHVTIHMNDFKCAICDKTYKGKQILKRHIKINHLRKKSTKKSPPSNEVLPDSTTDVTFDIIEFDDIKLEVEDI